MLDVDRVSYGWQPFLTPRQSRGRMLKEDREELAKLKEWFGHEAEIHKRKLGANLTGDTE